MQQEGEGALRGALRGAHIEMGGGGSKDHMGLIKDSGCAHLDSTPLIPHLLGVSEVLLPGTGIPEVTEVLLR